MSKRIVALFLVMGLTICLCGCQLAKPEGEAPSSPDRLIGVFVTREHLDLFDVEGYLQDHIGSFSGGEITIDSAPEYRQRVYATLVKEPFQDSAGQQHFHCNYAFPELDGTILAVYQMDDGEGAYRSSDAGEGFCNVSVQFLETENVISGTLWQALDSGEVCYYLNPVFQTSDGQVYLTAGSGIQTNSDLGGRMTGTLSETYTVTENGQTREESFRAEVTVDFVRPADRVTILQMNEAHQEIGRDVFPAENLPEQYTPDGEAAYLLVEVCSGTEILRQLCQPEDDRFSVFVPLDARLCTEHFTAVNWQDPA